MAKCNVIKHRHQTQAAVAPFYALRRTNLARYAKKERKKEREKWLDCDHRQSLLMRRSWR